MDDSPAEMDDPPAEMDDSPSEMDDSSSEMDDSSAEKDDPPVYQDTKPPHPRPEWATEDEWVEFEVPGKNLMVYAHTHAWIWANLVWIRGELAINLALADRTKTGYQEWRGYLPKVNVLIVDAKNENEEVYFGTLNTRFNTALNIKYARGRPWFFHTDPIRFRDCPLDKHLKGFLYFTEEYPIGDLFDNWEYLPPPKVGSIVHQVQLEPTAGHGNE